MPTNISSDSISLGRLIASSDVRYAVPPFQRDYSWSSAQVGELWEDIIATLDEGRDEHFMGAIVVDSSDKPHQLIDGQQRVATFSLLMCVLRDIAKLHGDGELSSVISQKYLGALNLRSRRIEAKLTLNDRNDDFYKEYILEFKGLDEIEKQASKRTAAKSNKLIAEAYLLLYKKVQERILEVGDFQEAIIQLEECVRDKCISIVIYVTDEANAYLIFETLNDRGLDLSVSDLLKNYLFSRAATKLSEVQSKWEFINQSVGKFEV